MNNKAYTLLEVLVSVILLSILALGTFSYYHMKRWDRERELRRVLAYTNMASRIDIALATDYFVIQDSIPEISKPLLIDGFQGFRTTRVHQVDDPFDGLAPADTTLPDYLRVTVSFAWFTPDNVSDTLSCSISKERHWYY